MSNQAALKQPGVGEAQILEELKAVLADNFEIDPARVTLDANLFADLDLDSIDAVDLAIRLQEMTGKRIKPQEFKTIRTVRDVVGAIKQLLTG